MSLGVAIGLAVGILAGMFVMLFVLAAVEEGMFTPPVEAVEDLDPAALLDVDGEADPLGQVA